jgi:hypothetical protein
MAAPTVERVRIVTPRKPTRAKQLGVSDEQYELLLYAQGGHCALCPNVPKTRRLAVDHDHRSGQVRGLLCHRCNRALPTWITAGWLIQAAGYIVGGSGRAYPMASPVLDEINGAGA